ncbi:hypothetical protein [Flavobacterium silvaticum]|uniref:DUF4595 domain-containing protein n=1 Tax=Flavobacterium silvaticum TaxID=1852020 RepID=A0A972JH33_9FLAO|nr:hypothetical protein [Flavobacterium silvaticum]NMH26698.1 hypothetical protein [Flavobacterium silvaticum]
MKIKFLPILGILLFLAACSEDNSNEEPATFNLTHYKETRSYTFQGVDYQNIRDVQIEGNKIQSYTYESFTDGISQGLISEDDYTYNGDGRVIAKINSDSDSRQYYYDSQQRVIGISAVIGGTEAYVRFVYLPDGIVYNERINAPYDDSNAHISSRCIIKLDDEGHVIWAGVDPDKNGIADSVRNYVYSGQDLSQVVFPDGSVSNFVYGTAKNSMLFLTLQSYGHDMYNLINAPLWAQGNEEHIRDIMDSEHLLVDTDTDSSMLELFENNFVQKITKYEYHEWTGEPVTVITSTTEFFTD